MSSDSPNEPINPRKPPQPIQPLFELGQVVITPGAWELLHTNNINLLSVVFRHVCGDWGKLDAHDSKANDAAVLDGSRILSNYPITDTESVWVITESDRSVTTLLLPSEY